MIVFTVIGILTVVILSGLGLVAVVSGFLGDL